MLKTYTTPPASLFNYGTCMGESVEIIEKHIRKHDDLIEYCQTQLNFWVNNTYWLDAMKDSRKVSKELKEILEEAK